MEFIVFLFFCIINVFVIGIFIANHLICEQNEKEIQDDIVKDYPKEKNSAMMGLARQIEADMYNYSFDTKELKNNKKNLIKKKFKKKSKEFKNKKKKLIKKKFKKK